MNKDSKKDHDTKERLILAGLELFGREGFAGVTTRALSAAAKANQSAIPYYFGGKQGLYEAVAHHVAEGLTVQMREVMAHVQEQAPLVAGDREKVAELLMVFIRSLVRRVAASPDLQLYRVFMLRHVTTPGVAFDILYDGAWQHFNRTLSVIAASAGSIDPDSPDAVMRAQSLMAMIMSLGAGKAVVCRRLGWDDYSAEAIELVENVAIKMACSALELPHGQGV